MTADMNDLSEAPPLLGDLLGPEHHTEAPTPQRRVLERYLDPLRPYLADDRLTEVVVNRPGEVFTEGAHGWIRHDAPALTGQHLGNLALAAAAYTRQDIAPDHPIVSTVLPGGERCQVVVSPAVPAGTVTLLVKESAEGRELARDDIREDPAVRLREGTDRQILQHRHARQHAVALRHRADPDPAHRDRGAAAQRAVQRPRAAPRASGGR